MSGLPDKGTPLLGRENAMLVMIDFQERLIPAMAEREKLLENAVKLARFSRIIGMPVIVTEQQKLGSTLQELNEAMGNPEPISKVNFNCFGCDEFSERMRKDRPQTLIIAGIEAHICVLQTALHGLSEHRVHVVGDAVSSRTLQNKDLALRRMEREGVTITSTEMLIYELLKKAGTDEFREVLKLVK